MELTIVGCITVLFFVWLACDKFKKMYIFWGVVAAFAGVFLFALGAIEGETMGFLTAFIYTWFLIVVCAGIILKKLDKLSRRTDDEKNGEEQE